MGKQGLIQDFLLGDGKTCRRLHTVGLLEDFFVGVVGRSIACV